TYATPTSGGATVGTTPATQRRTVPAPPRPRNGQRPSSLFTASTAASSATRNEPRLRQLVGVCVWAALIGGLALILGLRRMIGPLTDDPAGWYLPAVISVGLVGLGSTVAAFLTVSRRWIPFALLGAATALVITALFLTANAF